MILTLVSDLKPGMKLGQDVFATPESISPLVRIGTVLTANSIKRIASHDITSVQVDDSKKEKPCLPPQYEPPVTPQAPAINGLLRDEALETLENIFEGAHWQNNEVLISGETAAQVSAVVEKMVGNMLEDHANLVNINNLRSYDDYTYHHSLSVSVLSIAIAHEMGLHTRELNQLGTCAIMHDIGKTAIPVEIIRKPSRLDDNEFKLIKTHSFAGYEYLTHSTIGDEHMWQGVLHHHEKLDGTGYPDGLKSKEIPIWSKIISAADVYDALTSSRPYRTPMQPLDAVEYLMGGIGTSFDYDVISALVKKVDLYPIGTVIELSDKRLATVLDNTNTMRPIIKIFGTGEVIDLYRDRKALSIVIKRIISDPIT